MAGFQLKKNLPELECRKVRISSQAYTEGDAVQWDRTSDSVDVTPATSSTVVQNIAGVAAETVTSSATELLIRVLDGSPSQTWECEVANTVSANHNYQRMVLTDANTVNNTGTDSTADEAVVEQVGILGAKGLFRFIQGGEST